MGVVAVARREMERIATNGEYRSVAVWLPLGVILFFAIFFSQEVVGSLPVAVIDEDNSYLSRRLVSMIYASHEVADVREVADMAEARAQLLSGEVVGVVEIPEGFARSILSGVTAEVVYYDSGTNISTASLSSKGVNTAVSLRTISFFAACRNVRYASKWRTASSGSGRNLRSISNMC